MYYLRELKRLPLGKDSEDPLHVCLSVESMKLLSAVCVENTSRAVLLNDALVNFLKIQVNNGGAALLTV